MTAKSDPRLFPDLLQNRQYSGTITVVAYNWPIFLCLLLFGVVTLLAGSVVAGPWNTLLLASGALSLIFVGVVITASFFVYDWGPTREYDRLAQLAGVDNANVVIDITAGKLRGTRGMLSRVKGGHYFVVDIFDPEKMTDNALRRAREMEPPLVADRRIYRRTASPASLPIPHNWADVVYCSFSLHELQNVDERDAIFAEFARILKSSGKLVIAEHGRDLRNLLAFGPGVFSFFSPAAWEKHIATAGFEVSNHERWRGLVHLWVAQKHAR